MIILKKEKREKTEKERVEFGLDLSPDDLDFRGNNIQKKEQMNNSSEEKKFNQNASKRNK